MFMEWLRKAPTAVTVTVIIVCGFIAMGLVAAFVVLTLAGADTTEFRQWVNTVGQIMVFPLLGTTAVASVAAARASSKTEDQTNGNLSALQQEVNRLSVILAGRKSEQQDRPE